MDTLVQKELDAISGYIRINYYTKLKKKESSNCNIIIDNGIKLIIQKYCKPLLLTSINARELSYYTVADHTYKVSSFDPQHISNIKYSPNHYKCVLVGCGAVGKTSLLITFTTGEFPGGYIPTVFDNYSHDIRIDNKSMEIDLWDTAGAEDYPRLRPLSYPQTDVFMICMSVYDDPSCSYWGKHDLDKSGMWTDFAVHTMAFCQEIQTLCPDVPRILVGTKTDLRDDKKCIDNCYAKEEMEHFAEVWECDGYVECSALKGYNVKKTFDYIMRKAMKCRRELLGLNGSKKDCVVL